jgi:Protein of unknown function (DUF3558)
MRVHPTKTTVAMAMGLVLLAGCAHDQGGAATTGGPTGSTDTVVPESTAPSTAGAAPKVTKPLDASKFLTKPCTVLTAAQRKDFNISRPGEPDTDSTIAKFSGPGCSWRNDDEPVSTGYFMSFLSGNKNGLSDTYRGGKEAFPGYFEPTEVDGYPAVFNDLSDGRPSGACNITVGISDTLTFRASEQGTRGAKSCDGAKAVASAVIQTLKAE